MSRPSSGRSSEVNDALSPTFISKLTGSPSLTYCTHLTCIRQFTVTLTQSQVELKPHVSLKWKKKYRCIPGLARYLGKLFWQCMDGTTLRCRYSPGDPPWLLQRLLSMLSAALLKLIRFPDFLREATHCIESRLAMVRASKAEAHRLKLMEGKRTDEETSASQLSLLYTQQLANVSSQLALAASNS